MDFSLWKLSYIDLILVLKFLSTMDRDLIGIFKIDKSMYKSMFTKILPNPVQVLGRRYQTLQPLQHFWLHLAVQYSRKVHCYKYKLTKPGSGGFLATPMLKQVLNSAIECLQEQELEKKLLPKKLCRNKYWKNSILVPA